MRFIIQIMHTETFRQNTEKQDCVSQNLNYICICYVERAGNIAQRIS